MTVDLTVDLTRDGPIAILTIDNPPVNALSQPVRARLCALAEEVNADGGIKAVVLAGAGRLFVGGADISEFDRPPEPPQLPELLALIEAAPKPWIAAVHGMALGGGLELALACHCRVASHGATLGLPEVTLGIIPGAGGTQRLPRLIGVEAALPVIAERQTLDAAKALVLGLLDRTTAGSAVAEAIALARQVMTGPVPPPARLRPVNDPGDAFWQEAETRIARSSKGLSAPPLALDALRHGVQQGFAQGLARERDTFLRLRAGQESAALRYLFFAERAASRPAALKGIDPLPLRAVGVVGGGTMGVGIAAALRAAGFPVVLSEVDDARLARGLAALTSLIEASAKRGLITAQEADEQMRGVRAATGLSAMSECDLVIEAVFEDLGVKRQVFADLAGVCRAGAVLATNTSYIDPRKITQGLEGQDRFIGLHFFSPAQIMKLLEIIPLPSTSLDVLATGFALASKLRKVPVQSGICDGFIGNRILRRYRSEAESLVRSGVPHADIDAAMRRFGHAMGPFEMQDLAGLDISFMQREALRAEGQSVPETLGDILVRAGRKGQKTGGGWYDYASGDRTPRPSPEVARLLAPVCAAQRPCPPDDIAERLVAAMAAEGSDILAEGIAARPEDIDLVEVHGYGFPRAKGGPMFLTRRQGKA